MRGSNARQLGLDARWSFVVLVLTLLLDSVAHPVQANDWQACDTAGSNAEALLQLPPGLLLAIGRVESGRHDRNSGRIVPWPWTINAAGKGQSFDDAGSAIAATRALISRGIASIDVGCFQVNLAFHPDAFKTLEVAFDPSANARAAAGFLAGLHGQTGSWDGAIAAYHSSTPERGIPYRLRVLAQWSQGRPENRLEVPVLRELSWSPAREGVQVWKPSSPGTAPSIISIQASPEFP